jgi:hypothetical protein
VPNPFSRTLRAYAVDARAAAASAPVEIAIGLLLAITLSAEVRSGEFKENHWVRLAGSAVLAFPLVFSASVLRARGVVPSALRWGATAGVLAACAAFGLLWFDPDRSAHGWRWFMLVNAAVLVLGLTSGVPWGGRDRRRSWAFAWRLAERLVGVGLYSVALYGILAGAFAAVVNLFDLKRPQHLFTDLAGAVFLGVAPWIFVGGIHRLIAPPPEGGAPVTVGRLGRWLYAPVLVIYLAILYAYALKVLATGELPKNLVSPLVIAAGMIGFVGAVLLEPVHDDDEHRGLSLLVRWMPALLLPLVPLAFWAVLQRLGQYGWTEFRYLRAAVLVVLAVLAAMGTLRLVRRGPPLMSTIPAVMAAALLVSALGPWGALAVSKRDQTTRLRAALAQAKADPARLPGDTVTVDTLLFARIDGGARYLLQAHGRRALLAVVPRLPRDVEPWQVGRALGFRRGCGRGPAEGWGNSSFDWREGITGVIGGAIVRLEARDGQVMQARARGAAYRVSLSRDRLSVEGPGWRAEGTLAEVRRQQALHVATDCDRWMEPAPELPSSLARLDLRDAAGRVRAQVLMEHVSIGGRTPGPGEGIAVPAGRGESVGTAPETPGTAVRMLSGYMIVAP